jgi:hypothetical protein
VDAGSVIKCPVLASCLLFPWVSSPHVRVPRFECSPPSWGSLNETVTVIYLSSRMTALARPGSNCKAQTPQLSNLVMGTDRRA